MAENTKDYIQKRPSRGRQSAKRAGIEIPDKTPRLPIVEQEQTDTM